MGVSLLGEPVGCAPRLLPSLVPALWHSPSKALPPPTRPGDPQMCCWSHKPLVHSTPGAQFQLPIYFCHQTPPNNFGWCLCPHTAWQFPARPPTPHLPRDSSSFLVTSNVPKPPPPTPMPPTPPHALVPDRHPNTHSCPNPPASPSAPTQTASTTPLSPNTPLTAQAADSPSSPL